MADHVTAQIVWPRFEPGSERGRWLWSRRADLFWIAGGAYLLFVLVAVPATFLWRGFGAAAVVAFSHLGVAVNYPHYAATYELIVRERTRQPGNFRWLMVSIPVVVATVALGTAYHERLLAPLLRLYLTWSAYHYAAQHFGIAAMYSARGGRPLAADEKRGLQLAFIGVAGFMMFITNAFRFDPRTSDTYGPADVLLEPLVPLALYPLAVLSVLLGVAAALIGQARLKRRTGKGYDDVVWYLLGTNFAWFVLPYVWWPGLAGPWMGAQIGIWLPVALPFFHCAQYLGVTTHRARSSGDVRPVYLLVGLMAVGFALFEATALILTRATGLAEMRSLLIIASVVNIHHFWMDGIVWKRARRPQLLSS